MVGLTWRGDGDAEGVLDIPLDVTVQVRRPLALAT
jgi:S-DNA-T family DNA segregation ATPase FtsK/SpoIIIE